MSKKLKNELRSKLKKKLTLFKKISKNTSKKPAGKKLSGYIPFETLVKLLQQPGKKQDVLVLKKLSVNEKKSNKKQSNRRQKEEFVPLRELLRKIHKKKRSKR